MSLRPVAVRGELGITACMMLEESRMPRGSTRRGGGFSVRQNGARIARSSMPECCRLPGKTLQAVRPSGSTRPSRLFRPVFEGVVTCFCQRPVRGATPVRRVSTRCPGRRSHAAGGRGVRRRVGARMAGDRRASAVAASLRGMACKLLCSSRTDHPVRVCLAARSPRIAPGMYRSVTGWSVASCAGESCTSLPTGPTHAVASVRRPRALEARACCRACLRFKFTEETSA